MKSCIAALVFAAGAVPAVGLTTAQELRPYFIQRKLQEAAQEQDDEQQPLAEDVVAADSPMSALQEKPVVAAVSPMPQEKLGADGFPMLPEVSTMLGTAEQTLQGLTEQAASLEKRVQHAQKEKARKMAQQKAGYEGKLRAEELANRALVAQNKDISRQSQVLRNGNDAIRTHAQQLQASNLVMRQELLALQSRLGSVHDFVGQSLTRTDDSQAKELRVLKAAAGPAAEPQTQETQAPVQPANTVPLHSSIVKAHASKAEEVAATRTMAVSNTKAAAKDGDEADDDEEDDDATSLVEVGAAKQREEPPQRAAPTKPEAEGDAHELIKVLQKGVASLGEQERASEAQLRALFDSSFQAGAKRQRKLLAKQESLNSTRASLTALQGELRAAEAHLEATQKQLSKKLHDTGAFLQKLAHLALAPTSEVSGLTKVLPVSVSPTVAPSAAVETPAAFAQVADDDA